MLRRRRSVGLSDVEHRHRRDAHQLADLPRLSLRIQQRVAGVVQDWNPFGDRPENPDGLLATAHLADDHEPPDDLHDGWTPTAPQVDILHPDDTPLPAEEETWLEDLELDEEDVDREADRILAFEAMVRASMGPPEPSEAEIKRQLDRRDAWNECPYTPERLAEVNELTAEFYEARLPGSWAQPYLTRRLRQDITGHRTIRLGYAPDGWTTLIHHLRAQGVTDHEMLIAGVATTARTGRLIDRSSSMTAVVTSFRRATRRARR